MGTGRVTAGDIIYNIHRNLFAYAYEFLDRTLPIAGGDFLTSSLYSVYSRWGRVCRTGR